MRYDTCPECHLARRPGDDTSVERCPQCGLVFWKWEKHQQMLHDSPAAVLPKRPRNAQTDTETASAAESWLDLIRDGVRYCPDTDWSAWTGGSITFVAMCLWGRYFVFLGPQDADEIGGSFLHRVNLVFHEAGHVLFSPFGDFLYVLGGSLGQLMMPLIVMLAFFFRERNPFGAAVGLWWLGHSAMDLAIYIDDARALALPLLGGGTGYDDPDRHDWNHLLTRMGLLESDHLLASACYSMGRLSMLGACLWSGTILYRQYHRLRDGTMG